MTTRDAMTNRDDPSDGLEQPRDYLRPRWSDEDIEYALLRLQGRLRQRRRRRVALAVAATLIVVIGGGTLAGRHLLRQQEAGDNGGDSLLLATRPSAGAPPARRPDKPSPDNPQLHEQGTVELVEGSRYRPLSHRSKVVVQHVSRRAVRVSLARGAARFDVSKRPDRAFVVAAGPVQIEVVGTAFTVARRQPETTAARSEPARVRVVVHEGRVKVGWQGADTVLAQGDARWFPPLPKRVVERRARKRPRKRSRAWRRLAREGRYADAYDQLRRGRRARQRAVRDEPRDLFLAADTARLAGHPQSAVPYLERIVTRHRADPRASLAAFTLGRVLLGLGQPARAARQFARTRTLRPRGPLAEHALAREAEAWSRAKRTDRAQRAARLYLRRYPRGKRAGAVRRLTTP